MDKMQKYLQLKTRAEQIFRENPLVYCPFLRENITLNSDGFHHLRFTSNRKERSKNEQMLKFSLLPLVIQIIKKAGTVQEYRKTLCCIGKKSKKDGLAHAKMVEYWGFVAIVGEKNPIKIRVVLRRVGNGKIIFWSVMPAVKLNRDRIEVIRSLSKKGIEDD